MKSLSDFFKRIFPRKHKVEPLSADQIRDAKVRIIENSLGCVGATSKIANNDIVDRVIKDIESRDTLRQKRALYVLNVAEIKVYLFDSDLLSQLRQVDQQCQQK